jgi:hypothetical protein
MTSTTLVLTTFPFDIIYGPQILFEDLIFSIANHLNFLNELEWGNGQNQSYRSQIKPTTL